MGSIALKFLFPFACQSSPDFPTDLGDPAEQLVPNLFKLSSMNTLENIMFSSINFLSLLDYVIIKGACEHPGLTRSDHTKKFQNSLV